MGNGAARGATATEELDTTGQPQYVADEHAMSSPKSQVGCSSAKGVVMKPMLSLDMNSVNSRNAFLAENRHEIEVSGKPKLYRVPNSDAMEPGDKKLINVYDAVLEKHQGDGLTALLAFLTYLQDKEVGSTITISIYAKKEFSLNRNLPSEVIPSECKVEIKEPKIEITLKKGGDVTSGVTGAAWPDIGTEIEE
eukprot:gene14284-21910_t